MLDRSLHPGCRGSLGRSLAAFGLVGVDQHHADSHEEHLHQARREQPSGSGPASPGTRSPFEISLALDELRTIR
jgi:hypothetical protein